MLGKKQPLSRHKTRGTQQAAWKYSWRYSEFKKKSLFKFILINEFPSKQLSSTTESQTSLSCLKSALESYPSNSFDFSAQHHIPPSVQPGLCISHVLLLHVFWAYSQVLPYLQDPSSSDFPTPKWRHFFCLNYICFTGQRASRKKIINIDFFGKQLVISQAKLNPWCNCMKSMEEQTPKRALSQLSLKTEFNNTNL